MSDHDATTTSGDPDDGGGSGGSSGFNFWTWLTGLFGGSTGSTGGSSDSGSSGSGGGDTGTTNPGGNIPGEPGQGDNSGGSSPFAWSTPIFGALFGIVAVIVAVDFHHNRFLPWHWSSHISTLFR